MNFEAYSSRAEASDAAASRLATGLSAALPSGRTTLVVSGGSTPVACFNRLSGTTLEWSGVDVMLTDERCVDVSDERSNEAMVRRELMVAEAAGATFRVLSEDSVVQASAQLAAALVGVGEDGHFASIFPDLPDRDALLDPDAAPTVQKIRTAASDVERVTVNLSFLLCAPVLIILAFGENKRLLLENPLPGMPVRKLLEQDRRAVTVCWAP